MKTITLILFAIIIIVGAIAIIITKLYYRNKEKKEKQNLEAELGINRQYAPRNVENIESRRFRRRNDQQNEEIKRQSREIAAFSQSIPSQSNDEKIFDDYYGEPINSKFVKNENKPTARNVNANKSNPNVNKPITRKTPKTEEMERIINSPKSDKTISNINDIKDMTNKDAQVASKISQAPMDDAHKDFIKEHKKGKLVIDSEGGSGIKIVKNPNDEATDEIITKFGEIKRVKSNKAVEEDKEKSSSEEPEVPSVTEKVEEVKVTKDTDEEIEDTLNKIMEESNIETSPLLDEILKEINDSDVEAEESIIKVVEEETTVETSKDKTEEDTVETDEVKPRVRKLPEFNKEELETGETTLFDHQEKDKDEEIEEDPEDVITPIFNAGKKAFKSLKSNLLNEEVEEDEAASYIDDDYEEEFYAITPLSAEEIKKELQEETATITPLNEDNIKDEEDGEKELQKLEDDEKVKAKEELDRLREENTKKLVNMSKENEKSLASISKKPETKSSSKPTYEGPSEKIVIDGESYNLHKGLNIMFIYNNETYSSTILAMKPGFVGVKYRNKNVWVKNSRIKKVFKY